ncbi:hypothetical protein ScPMuIL_004689 [Solemya velum]
MTSLRTDTMAKNQDKKKSLLAAGDSDLDTIASGVKFSGSNITFDRRPSFKSMKERECAKSVFEDKTETAQRYSRLREIFEMADNDGLAGLSLDEFTIAIRNTVGHKLSDKDIECMFKKVDADCNGVVDWEEYLTYNMLEYQEKNAMYDMLKEKPFPGTMIEIKTRHRDMIVRVCLFPTIRKRPMMKNQIDFTNGKYVSLSKDGVLCFWSLGMKISRTCMVDIPSDRATQPWLTDMVVMYNINTLAIASTDRDLVIYDTSANKFIKRYLISGLDNCITTMNYWVDLEDLNKATLLMGDTSGNIYVIAFDSSLRGNLFGSAGKKQDSVKRVSFAEIVRGFHNGVHGYRMLNVHEDWVVQIDFLPEIGYFASCCQGSQTSLYLGDYLKKKNSSYIRVSKGILSFDYCPNRNILVTGGMDYMIRVWNPYVTNKPIVVLQGHSKPVTHVVVNSKRGHIISVDKGKSIRIFELKDQSCIQVVSGRTVKLGFLPVSSLLFNPQTETLILATNQMVLLNRDDGEERFSDVLSHSKSVVGALYSKTFNVVVSACHDSVISVWDINSGERIIQFANAHKKTEKGVDIPMDITAMSFDASGRRLVTGALDGSVKVWNFNNGACLNEYNIPGGAEVTGIVCTQHRIYVTGWCKHVYIYIDGAGEEHAKNWKELHKEDILCIGYLSPNIIATGSYDGDIVVWSRDTGQMYCRLNASKSNKPVTDYTRLPEVKGASGSPSEKSQTNIGMEGTDSDPSLQLHGAVKRATKGRPSRALGLLSKVRDRQESEEVRKSISSNKEVHEYIEHPLLSILNSNKNTPSPGFLPRIFTRKEYDKVCKNYASAVEKILFLEARDNLDVDTASLLVSGAEGWVRAWSIHPQGGLLGQFNAAHKVGENIQTMATNSKNTLLFTADTAGYLKIWDIREYCTKEQLSRKKRERHATALQKKFVYLRVELLRKKSTKESLSTGELPEEIDKRPPPAASMPKETLKYPLLVNSFRAHTQVINHVEYVEDRDLLITASSDCSIRLWTTCGRYIGTFGEPWDQLSGVVRPKTLRLLIPRELRRLGSAKTLKVLNGGQTPMWQIAFKAIRSRGFDRIKNQFEHLQTKEDGDLATEAKLESNILGKSYKRKVRHKIPPLLPKFIETPLSIAVYHALPFVDLEPIQTIRPPEIINEIQCRRYVTRTRMKMHGLARRRGTQGGILGIFNKVLHKQNMPNYNNKTPVRMKRVVSKLQKGAQMGVKLDLSNHEVNRGSTVQSTDIDVKEEESDDALSDTESVMSSGSHVSFASDQNGSRHDLKLPRINE